MSRFYLLVCVALLAACSSGPSYDQFGDGVRPPDDAVPVAQVLSTPEKHTGQPMKLRGRVQSVCKKKGCWMRVGGGQDAVFVRFKDYGFFVPKDAAGRQAVMQGTLYAKVQSVEQVKHLLEDAGKHEEAKQVKEPRKVYTFIASGVALEQQPAR